MDPKLLAKVPLFQKLPEKEIFHLADQMEIIDLPAGATLFQENDHGEAFYIVAAGEVEVIKAMGSEDERMLAIRNTGDFIGELSLINPSGKRMASVITKSGAKLWRLSRTNFDEAAKSNSLLAYQIIRELSQRLTTAHENTIADLQIKNAELTHAYNHLKEAQAQIIEKEKLEHELQVAHEIQQSILPEDIPQTDSFHFGTFLKPARSVGGDFFDIFPLGENHIGIMIGDVTDKGVPSALVMAQTHALIYAEAMRGQTPQQVMEKVNQMVMRINKSGLFITAIYGILDQENGRFTYARAGHEIPLMQDIGQTSILIAKSTGQPLGLLEDAIFDIQQIQFTPGRRLLLYTDGALDMHNRAGVQYGLGRLQKDFDNTAALSPQETCEFLYQKFAAHQGDTDQDDDITLILIQA